MVPLREFLRRVPLLAGLLLASIAGAQQVVPAAMPSADLDGEVTLDAAARAAVERREVRMDIHGTAWDCSGVALYDLLTAQGRVPEEVRGVQLARYVLVTARDGYRAMFSLAELAPRLAGHEVYVVDQCGGADLGEDVGPLRLLVPGDAHPARSMRQVESIHLRTAP